jgi:hypothetical protein
MESDTATTAEQKSRAERHRNQDLLIHSTTSSTVTGTLITSLSSLFLLQMGATPFHLGMLTTLGSGDKLARVLGLQLMGHLGKARLMFWGKVSSLVPAVALVFFALGGQQGKTAIWLTLGLLALRGVLQQLGNTAWWPLMQDSTAGEAMGAFMTRMRIRQRSVDLFLPILIGIYLGAQPSTQRFALPFALGLIATALAAWWISQVSEHRAPAPQQRLGQRLLQAIRIPSIWRYCRILMVRNLISAMSFPFWVVALTDRGMPVSYFVWMFSVTALGNLVGLLWWGRIIDTHGFRAILSLTLTGMAALGFAWLFLPSGVLALSLWASGIYLCMGLLEGGLQMAQTKIMVDAVPQQRQGEGFVVIMYASSIGGGLGGIAGGYAFEWTNQLEILSRSGSLVYLAIMQITYLGLWAMSTRLDGYREQISSVRLGRQLWQKITSR